MDVRIVEEAKDPVSLGGQRFGGTGSTNSAAYM